MLLIAVELTGLTGLSALPMHFLLLLPHRTGATYGNALGSNGMSTAFHVTVFADANAADQYRQPTAPDPLVVERTCAVSVNPNPPTMPPWVIVSTVITRLLRLGLLMLITVAVT